MLQWGCSWFDRTHFMGLCSLGESQSGAGIENGDLLYYWPMSPTMLETGRDMSVGRRRFWEKGKHRCLLHLSNVATEISLFSFPSTWLPAFLLFIFFSSCSSSCSLSLSLSTPKREWMLIHGQLWIFRSFASPVSKHFINTYTPLKGSVF